MLPSPPPHAALPGPEGLSLSIDDPTANLAVRVRRALDAVLAERIARLRAKGVRTSKAELVELLLWEQASLDDDEVAGRLATFRRRAPG